MIFRLRGRFPLLPRKKNADKSRYGHALLVAGCDAMPGAAILAAKAALVSGAGLVTLGSTERVTGLAVTAAPELLTFVPAADGAGSVFRYAGTRRVNAVAVGPGLSVGTDATRLVRRLVPLLDVPFVLDADGLNAFKGSPAALRRRKAPAILTPHEREFTRVFGDRVPSAAAPRARLVKHVAAAYHIVLVLKGHRTLVSDGARVYENRTGGPGLAKGGSGDVLTGMIAAFLAQGLDPFEAAAWAVNLHGRAGDRVARKTSELSVTATKVLEELPAIFRAASKRPA